MTKKIIAALLISLPLMGIGQGLRKKNAALEEEYLTKLQTYDSLFQMSDSVNRSYKEGCAQLHKKRGIYNDKRRELLKTKDDVKKRYKELMVLDSTASVPFTLASIESVSIPSDVFPKEITKEKLNYVNQDPKANFAVYLEVLSKKQQRERLLKTIHQIEHETRSLKNRMEEQLTYDTLISKTNRDIIRFTFPPVDSLQLDLNKKNQLLVDELKRITYLNSAKKDDGLRDWHNSPYSWGSEVQGEPPSMSTLPPPERPREDGSIVYTYVEESAEFPGGTSALKQYLMTNMKMPEKAERLGLSGKCYVQFVVNAQGKISKVEVKRGVPDCPECDNEAVRVVQGMPDWNPARNGGKAVNSLFYLPIHFKPQ